MLQVAIKDVFREPAVGLTAVAQDKEIYQLQNPLKALHSNHRRCGVLFSSAIA
jgi:hypothetical protein